MATHRTDVSLDFDVPIVATGRARPKARRRRNVAEMHVRDPEIETVAVTAWAADLCTPWSSSPADGVLSTSVTQLSAVGYVDYDAIDTRHSPPESRPSEATR